MEVILKEDVNKLGHRGDVVKVADGYGRNYLLPGKLAIEATLANKAVIEQMKGSAVRKTAKEKTAAEGLASQLNEVELVFVERRMEDVLTSNALLQAALGNLKFVTPDPAPYLAYLEGFTWKKSFYFSNFKVAHLDFAHIAGGGDLFANFIKLAYGLDLPELRPIAAGIDARNASSDEQIARGLVMAPLINWLEQFGSVSRFELFNAHQPVKTQVEGASWDAVVANVPLLRDCVRSTARRAIEMFVATPQALPA